MFPASLVGRKLAIAVTGQMMIAFVVLHVAGNVTIFFGAVNAYAAHLHALPLFVLLLTVRVLMLAAVSIHILFAILLTLDTSNVRPQPYVVRAYRNATLSGRSMIWSGAIVGAFIVYHLLHFTFQVTNPAISAVNHPDAAGRPDVLFMIVASFHRAAIVVAYLCGVAALGFHLFHGIQSSIQTVGLNNDRSLPVVTRIGELVAIVLFLGYAVIPAAVLTGALK